jgi:hypothetical protein
MCLQFVWIPVSRFPTPEAEDDNHPFRLPNPWVRNLIGYYGAGDLVGIADYLNVMRSLERFLARPAVAKGLYIPSNPAA